MLGGALQLVPMVRRRWPVFHRWNGRLFLFGTAVMSIGGLIMHVMSAVLSINNLAFQ